MNVSKRLLLSAVAASLLVGACKQTPKASVKTDAASNIICSDANVWWLALEGGALGLPALIAIGGLLSIGNGLLQESSVCKDQEHLLKIDDVAKVIGDEAERADAKIQYASIKAMWDQIPRFNDNPGGDGRTFWKQLRDMASETQSYYDKQGIDGAASWADSASIVLMSEKFMLVTDDKMNASETTRQADLLNLYKSLTGYADDLVTVVSFDDKIESLQRNADDAAQKFFDSDAKQVAQNNGSRIPTWKLCRDPKKFTDAEQAFLDSYGDQSIAPKALVLRAKAIKDGPVCVVGIGAKQHDELNTKINDKIVEIATSMKTDLIENNSRLIKLRSAISKIKCQYDFTQAKAKLNIDPATDNCGTSMAHLSP